MQKEQIISKLNSRFSFIRTRSLKKLQKEYPDELDYNCSNQIMLNIQSKYSYGPYYSAMTAYTAYKKGVVVAGLTDLISISGIKEFAKSCLMLSLPYVTGYREQITVPFLEKEFLTESIYGIPKNLYYKVDEHLKKEREIKYAYVKNAVHKLNQEYKQYGIKLHFEQDIVHHTLHDRGGSIANKQVFYALSLKIIEKCGKGKGTVDFITGKLKRNLSDSMIEKLSDENNPYYIFDLARALKDEKFFGVRNLKSDVELTAYAHSIEALAVFEIKTMDKKMVYRVADRAKEIGADGVAFTAYGFSDDDKDEICKYLVDRELLAVSLEVFDEPRKTPDNMFGSTYSYGIFKQHAYAIVGHEISVSSLSGDGFNSDKIKEKVPSFSDRINLFAEIGHRTV